MKPATLLAALLAAAALSPAGTFSQPLENRNAPTDLLAALAAPAPPSGTRLKRPGTPKEALSSAEDSLRKVYEVMRIASVGPLKRREILIVLREDAGEARQAGVGAGTEPPGRESVEDAAASGPAGSRENAPRKRIRLGISGIDGVTVESLLSRVDRFVTDEGPLLLKKAGGSEKAFRESAQRLRRLVLAAAQAGIGPTETDRALIRQSLLDLAGRLKELERLASVREPQPGEGPAVPQ